MNFSASASKIKMFHSWYNLKSKYIKESDLIDAIKGVKVSKVSFDLGNLVDSFVTDLLTNIDPDSLDSSYQKTCAAVGSNLHVNAESQLEEWVTGFKAFFPDYTTQAEGAKLYNTDLGNLNIKVRLDVLTPNIVFDIKTSKFPLSIDLYDRDMQGYIYTDIFNVDTMYYEHFQVSHSTNNVQYRGSYKLPREKKGYVEEVAGQFLAFCYKNNLTEYLLPPSIGLNSIYPRGKYKDVLVSDMIKEEAGINYLNWAIENTDIIFSNDLKEKINELQQIQASEHKK